MSPPFLCGRAGWRRARLTAVVWYLISIAAAASYLSSLMSPSRSSLGSDKIRINITTDLGASLQLYERMFITWQYFESSLQFGGMCEFVLLNVDVTYVHYHGDAFGSFIKFAFSFWSMWTFVAIKLRMSYENTKNILRLFLQNIWNAVFDTYLWNYTTWSLSFLKESLMPRLTWDMCDGLSLEWNCNILPSNFFMIFNGSDNLIITWYVYR